MSEILNGPKRLKNELIEMMQSQDLPEMQLLRPDGDNIYRWFALLMPRQFPYDQGAYALQIDFPKRYPFVPPILHITTKTYHPNINERGQLCIPILEAENWIPTSRMCTVLNVILATFNDPQPENSFYPEMAHLYVGDRNKFDRIAAAWVYRYAEVRPTDKQLKKLKKKLAAKVVSAN